MEYKLTQSVQEEALKTLEEWIAIPSVLDESASETPFGEDIQRMLERALATCES